MLSFLKEAEVVTRSSLESVLCFITGPISQLKLSSQSEYLCDSEVSDTNLFEMVDTVLKLLISSKPSSTENFQSHVQSLELCIEDIEVGVERLSRQLIRTRCVDGILEGSLRFLDICSTAKECRQISKESLHELHSVIKRRKANETVFTTEGGKYLASRNKLKKAIRKALRNLKTIKSDLPSRPHPLILKCNEHLESLRASNETSSSLSNLRHKVGGLQDLIECVEKLIQLPLTQDVFLHECQENWVDELLDGSLRLLDVCTSAKEALLHTKECTRELQSIIRRKRGGEVELTAEVKKFLTSRKTLLQFISGSTRSKSNNWLSISKLIQPKRVGCSLVADESEFAQLDAALQSFVCKTCKFEDTNNLQNHLEKMESCIQDFEEGLEFLFRRLIKIRVSLLNILNH
ncbi:hypothetical protein GmHk_06G014804 [Glycine max]|nr:hypothetical protein GmHk_06G014804 [Glycine max]